MHKMGVLGIVIVHMHICIKYMLHSIASTSLARTLVPRTEILSSAIVRFVMGVYVRNFVHATRTSLLDSERRQSHQAGLHNPAKKSTH